MGKRSHSISIEPILVNGILCEDQNNFSQSAAISEVTCVLSMKDDNSIRSKSSMPIQHVHQENRPHLSCCTAKWDDECMMFETKLDGEKAKKFDFCIHLRRGFEEIFIGTFTIIFVGVVLGAQVELPIQHDRDTKDNHSRRYQKSGLLRRKRKVNQNAVGDQLLAAKGQVIQTIFRVGDGNRSYSLSNRASVIIKVSS